MTPELSAFLETDPDVVPLVRLISFDFQSGMVRLAESVTPVTAGGFTWQPHFGWVEAKPLQITNNPFDANPANYIVWGVGSNEGADLAYAALNNPEEWWGRRIVQGFTVRGFHDFIVVHSGFMRTIRPSESSGLAQIEIKAESIASKRNYTPLGEYTPRDQARRFPNITDKAFDYVSSIPGKQIQGWLIS